MPSSVHLMHFCFFSTSNILFVSGPKSFSCMLAIAFGHLARPCLACICHAFNFPDDTRRTAHTSSHCVVAVGLHTQTLQESISSSLALLVLMLRCVWVLLGSQATCSPQGNVWRWGCFIDIVHSRTGEMLLMHRAAFKWLSNQCLSDCMCSTGLYTVQLGQFIKHRFYHDISHVLTFKKMSVWWATKSISWHIPKAYMLGSTKMFNCS